MCFWNSLTFLKIQKMLAIWSLVPVPFLNPAWTPGSSQVTYYWLGEFWALLASVWDECNCAVVWTFFVIAFLWDWSENLEQNLVRIRTQEEEQWPQRRLTLTCLWVFTSLRQRHALVMACCKVRGTECGSAWAGPLEGGRCYLHYLHHGLASGQTTGREHSPAHQQKIGLKIYWTWAKAFDCVDHHELWKILQEMGIPDHLTCLLKQQFELDMEQKTDSKSGKDYGKAVYCHCAYLTSM